MDSNLREFPVGLWLSLCASLRVGDTPGCFQASEPVVCQILGHMRDSHGALTITEHKKPRKARGVIDAAKLGQIAELTSRLPRLTYRELAALTGIAESTLKGNQKVRNVIASQRGSFYCETQDRHAKRWTSDFSEVFPKSRHAESL